MFKGSYWITEVSHSIRNNNITTTFKGSRMPYSSLPDLSDSFMSSYKALFDKLVKKAQNRVNGADRVTNTSEQLRVLSDVTINGKTQTTPDTITIDRGQNIDENEIVVTETGITDFGIPFNGYMDERFIQKITHSQHDSKTNNGTWLRTRVVQMGDRFNILNDTSVMLIIDGLSSNSNSIIDGQRLPTQLNWLEVKKETKNQHFYSTKFKFNKNVNADKIITAKTIFLNPKNNKTVTVNPKYKLDYLKSDPRVFNGPLDIFPEKDEPNGMGMSIKLMKDLGLNDGDVVYFNLI
jgi:hypothetical protein